MKVRIKIATLLALSLLASPTIARADDGLVIVDRGAAVFYSPSFDYGGWQSIIAKRIAWGEHDPDTFPYSPDGFYCVHPDYVFGNVLTIRNRATGATARCTIADSVAPQDQANWRAHAAIEISYRLFQSLDLGDGNAVDVLALPNG